jgi:hypothetical protein
VVQLVVKDGGYDDVSLRVLCLERQALEIPSADAPQQADHPSDGRARNPADSVAEQLHLEVPSPSLPSPLSLPNH